MENDILTVEEVAELLKVSTKTIIRFINKKSLKASKLGRSWRIRKSDINDFLEKNSNQ
jgi:excisionase family DNA binding protein